MPQCTKVRGIPKDAEDAEDTHEGGAGYDDDKFEGNLQEKLFDATNVGKRRDLQLIYDVSERALEIKVDDTLDEQSLQEMAANFGNMSFVNTFHTFLS